MERITIDVDHTHLCIRYPDGLGVAVLIKLALHIKPLVRRCSPNELHDDLMTDERLAPPVLRNKREQSVLYAVPFACPGRMVNDCNGQTSLIGEALKFMFPEPNALLPPQSAVISRSLASG